ncbi:MAG: hypothetical protein E7625_04235 [Ruminococcaceae bacterium]|nr:hypothetical protein [Oscillospiraceae bacterium]
MNVKNRIPNARNKVALCEAVGEVVRKLKGDCAMKKRFLKNLFQMIPFLVMDLVMLGVSFLFFLSDEPDVALIAIFWFGVLLFFNICGLYWMAQTVVIDERGITRYFFKKQLEHIPWWEILSVRKAYHNRSSCYEFTQDRIAPGFVDVKACLRLDRRKAIKRAVLAYAPPHIRKQMEDLK